MRPNAIAAISDLSTGRTNLKYGMNLRIANRSKNVGAVYWSRGESGYRKRAGRRWPGGAKIWRFRAMAKCEEAIRTRSADSYDAPVSIPIRTRKPDMTLTDVGNTNLRTRYKALRKTLLGYMPF